MKLAVLLFAIASPASADALLDRDILPFGVPIEDSAGSERSSTLSKDELATCIVLNNAIADAAHALEIEKTNVELDDAELKYTEFQSREGKKRESDVVEQEKKLEARIDSYLRLRSDYVARTLEFLTNCSVKKYLKDDARNLLTILGSGG
jgi:hypothetical protein